MRSRKKEYEIRGAYDKFTDFFRMGTFIDTIYPTPPLGQDMTQGQFLSGV